MGVEEQTKETKQGDKQHKGENPTRKNLQIMKTSKRNKLMTELKKRFIQKNHITKEEKLVKICKVIHQNMNSNLENNMLLNIFNNVTS